MPSFGEWSEQIKLTEQLEELLDPACTFSTSIDSYAGSALTGASRRRRGVRAGVPDVLVLYRGKLVGIELKSARGVASETQKQVRDRFVAAGADWWLCRSANAALVALQLSGVKFRREWQRPRLADWEGPFSDPHRRLPQAPDVRIQRRAASRRLRARIKCRPVPREDLAATIRSQIERRQRS